MVARTRAAVDRQRADGDRVGQGDDIVIGTTEQGKDARHAGTGHRESVGFTDTIDGQVLDHDQVDRGCDGGDLKAIDIDDIDIAGTRDRDAVTGRRSSAIDVDLGRRAGDQIDEDLVVVIAGCDGDRLREARHLGIDRDLVETAQGRDFDGCEACIGRRQAVDDDCRCSDDHDIVDAVITIDVDLVVAAAAADHASQCRTGTEDDTVFSCATGEVLDQGEDQLHDGGGHIDEFAHVGAGDRPQ